MASQWGADPFDVDAATDQPSERRVALRVAVDIQALVGQVTDARREALPDASQGGESRLAYDYFRFVR